MSSQPPSQSSEKKELVKFLPFKSTAPPSFWLNHNERKLNDLKLSEEGVPLVGYFAPSSNKGATIGNVTSRVIGTPMQFDSFAASTNRNFKDDTSNDEDSSTATTNQDDTASETIRRNEYIKSTGSIYSLNTLESFKTINKNEFLNDNCLPALLKCCGIVGNQLKQDDASNSSHVRSIVNVEEDYEEYDPNLALISTVCLTYCNLKTNNTLYWFGYPALVPRTGCGIAYYYDSTTATYSTSSSSSTKRM